MSEVDVVATRPARPGDHEFLRLLYATTRDDLDVLDWDADVRAAFCAQQWWAQHTHYTRHFPDATHDIVVVDGEDVGRVWVDRRVDEIRLLDIAILPAHRGRGIGTQILRRLQDEASSTGQALRHSVEAGNADARRWYEGIGFEIVEHGDTHHLMAWRPR